MKLCIFRVQIPIHQPSLHLESIHPLIIYVNQGYLQVTPKSSQKLLWLKNLAIWGTLNRLTVRPNDIHRFHHQVSWCDSYCWAPWTIGWCRWSPGTRCLAMPRSSTMSSCFLPQNLTSYWRSHKMKQVFFQLLTRMFQLFATGHFWQVILNMLELFRDILGIHHSNCSFGWALLLTWCSNQALDDHDLMCRHAASLLAEIVSGWASSQPLYAAGPKIPKGYSSCPCLTNKYSSASSLTAPPQIMAHQPNHPSPASRTPWTLLLSKPNGDEQDAPRQGMSNGSHEAGDELSTKKNTTSKSPTFQPKR